MTRHLPLIVIAAIVAVIAAIPPARVTFLTGFELLATGKLAHFQQYLLSLGLWAPIVSIGLMTAQSVFIPLPVTIIMLANGLVFGLWRGMLVSLTGALIGALTAYAIGHHFGRALVERLLPASSLETADRLMAKHRNWAIVLSRWVPGVPGDPMSYAAGLTRVPLMPFFLLTVAALLPANLATAYVGEHVAGDVPTVYWLSGIGVVVAASLTWRLFKRRRDGRRLASEHAKLANRP